MHKGNFFCRLLFCSLPVLAGAAFWCAGAAAPAPKLTEEQKSSLIARLSARLLEHNHYRQQKIDQEISGKAFDLFFKSLDPNRMYFTAADIAEFEPERATLASDLLNGKTDFGDRVYARYLQRFKEYQEFAEKELAGKLDFTTDETVDLDRTHAPYFDNEAAMHDFWRKKLKNDVLYFRLMQRALKLDEEQNKQENADGSDDLAAVRALWESKTPEEKILRRLHDISIQISQMSQEDVLALLLSALAHAYGPHSDYNSEKMDQQFDISMSLSLTGIGATLTSDDGFTRVVELIPGGPAALDGTLQPEDRIIAVAQADGEPVDVIDMALDNVVQMIRGPEGSKVTLTILPGRLGRNAVPRTLTLTRAKIELKESEVKGDVRTVQTPDGKELKVGVIDFNRFYVDFEALANGDADYKSCARDMHRVLEELQKQGVDAIVLDLRYNGGGGLSEAIALSGLFIKDGPIVQVRGSNRKISIESDPDAGIVYSGPLVLLTSKLTASAAEILTGVIHDYQRGIVVGDSRTYGKGTVLDVVKLERLLGQVNVPFPAGSLRYETAQFYGVNGDSNQQLGIASDIVLPSLTEEMEIGESYSDNHLPWDQIEGLKHDVYDADIAKHREELKAKSEARRAQSADYQQLMHSIEVFRRYRDRSAVSLNEEKRFAEYLEERRTQDKEEALLLGKDQQDGKRPEKDPELDEAVNIAADYAESLEHKTAE